MLVKLKLRLEAELDVDDGDWFQGAVADALEAHVANLREDDSPVKGIIDVPNGKLSYVLGVE